MSRSGLPDSLINDWFTIGKTITKTETLTHTAKLRERRRYEEDDVQSQVSVGTSASDQSYARYYQELEARDALLGSAHEITERGTGSRSRPDSSSLRLNDEETLTTTTGTFPRLEDLLGEDNLRVYRNYDFGCRLDSQLPIYGYKEQILNMIESNRVTIIQGTTGSGKTTQVPQYILDKYASEERYCNIIVTQPRRIAAMSIARRVCAERNWRLGQLVGYQVGLDKTLSPDTRLSYVTTGVLLQKLVTGKTMSAYTHVILDEIHERDMESDFLLLIVRKLSRTVSKDTKVVLMSATMDLDLHSGYFSVPVGDRMVKATSILIESKMFKIFDFYLEDVIKESVPLFEHDQPRIAPEATEAAKRIILGLDYIETKGLKEGGEFALERGAVLVFLPGLEEIDEMFNLLDTDMIRKKWNIIPLHSSISWEEQGNIFKKPEPGYRKIILATNIAESSITVTDIKYVIDFCLTKNMICDPSSNYTFLQLEWASKANCMQRRGRAGRVANGRVYRMVTHEFYDTLPDYGIPEMKRCSLDKAVLDAKTFDAGEPKAILGLALDPPDLSDIERTILTLMEVGALAAKCNKRGIISSQDGDLTYVGKVIAALPIDIHLGKLIVLGHIFGCLEDCIIMAAGLSQKNVFTKPYNSLLNAYKRKMEWADGSFSDCIAILNVYKVWEVQTNGNYFNRPGGLNEKAWGARSFIQISRLHEVHRLVEELKRRLSSFGIYLPHRTTADRKSNDGLILKIVIAGAFYPHYFTQGMLDEREVIRDVGGHDPCTTVTLTGVPPKHGILYSNCIKEMLQECGSKMKIHFSLSKAYVEFDRLNTGDAARNSSIPPEMFLAIKMRMQRIPVELHLLPEDVATRHLERLKLIEAKGASRARQPLSTDRVSSISYWSIQQVKLPDLQTATIDINVSEIVDCSHFWAIYASDEYSTRLRHICDLIKQNIERHSRPVNRPVLPGMLFLAPYGSPVEYYRARVEAVSAQNISIFFIDYGTVSNVKKSDLYMIDEVEFPELMTFPMQAFECVLAGVRPSSLTCPSGTWTAEANNYMRKVIGQKRVHGRVYSVVHRVVHLEVIYEKTKGQRASFNDELKKLKFAEFAEEDQLSQQNYKLRCQAQSDHAIKEDYQPPEVQFSTLPNSQQLKEWTEGCHKKTLRGPFSSLEMSFTGLCRASSLRAVRIEQDSVNSVALDVDYRDTHSRLLVASDINLTSTGSSVVARSTTLLPNIHGLLSTIVLMFSPKVEFRTDPLRKRYTGALCGLGFLESNSNSMYPDHDMEILFDTLLKQDDLIKINYIRICINLLLGSAEQATQTNASSTAKIQSQLRKDVIDLVSQPKESVTPIGFRAPYKWNMVPPELLLHPQLQGTAADVLHILPLLSGISLEAETDDYDRVSVKRA